MMRLSRRFARLRRWLLRRDYVALATQVAISLLILLLVALVTGGRRGDVTVSEERTLIRDEQPQAVAQPERPEAAIVAVSPAPATKPADLDPAQAPAFEMAGPFLSVDGTSLRRGDGVVSLDRVEGPRADDVCEDAGGALWACGLHARAVLHNLLTGRGARLHAEAGLGPRNDHRRLPFQGAGRRHVRRSRRRSGPARLGEAARRSGRRTGRGRRGGPQGGDGALAGWLDDQKALIGRA